MNWLHTYSSSLKRVITRPAGIIICLVYLLAQVFFVIIVPVLAILPTSSLSYMLIFMIDMYSLILSAALFTVISNVCYEMNEMTFILSRPISRNAYLSAKISAQLSITFVLSFFTFIMWIILNEISKGGTLGIVSVFGTGFNLINVILPALAIAIFSAASVVLIKPYVKGGVLPLFTILIAMVTTTPYFIIAMIDSKISDATAIFNSTFLIPFLTFAILGVVLFPFCFLQINFLKVKV